MTLVLDFVRFTGDPSGPIASPLDPTQWEFMKRGADLSQMLFAEPLTAEQMAKLSRNVLLDVDESFDEIAGIAITFIAVPPSWLTVLVGFCLFRLLDVVKPWPIRWVDKSMGGGLGIMADDVLAGLIACAGLHGLLGYGLI